LEITPRDLPFFGKVMLPNIKSLGCIVNILKENLIKSKMNYPAASYGVSKASIRNRPFVAS
jgi:hypothetical protein